MRPLLALLAIFLPRLCADISIVGPIESRFDTADLVCRVSVLASTPVSRVGAQDENGKLKPVDYLVRFSADRCYKGEPSSREIIIQISNLSLMNGVPFGGGGYVVAFLNGLGNPYTYRDLNESFIQSWPMETPAGPVTKGISQLEADILKVLTGNDPTRSKEALNILLFFSHLSPGAESSLHQFKASSDEELRIRSLEAQVLASAALDEASLVRRRDAIREYAAALRGSAQLTRPVGEAVGRVLSTEANLADLDMLEDIATTSPNPSLRLYSMLGIRRLATSQTLPFLINQLDASDTTVQFQAIMTLAEITGKTGEYGPGMNLFENNPAKYTSIWKKWWITDRINRNAR